MTEKIRPRTIVTTDGEIDDIDSFIRYLLYTNDVETAGIILTSSKFHYSGTDTKPALRWTGTRWPLDMIEAYAEVYPNLIKHDPNYPTPESLKNVYKLGNITDEGEMEQVTEGSELITNVLLDDDPRPVYVQTWGGTNTTARALKSIQERYEGTEQWQSIKAKVEEKMILYIILNQDNTYEDYISKNWNLNIINDYTNFGFFAYVWKYLPESIQSVFKPQWFLENIVNKGELLRKYALIGDGHYLKGEDDNNQFGNQSYLDAHPESEKYEFISEGDSPSYFYLLAQDLRATENPSYGGWGGRFQSDKGKIYKNGTFDYNPETGQFEMEYGITRWFKDIQADFAARARWCISETFEETNHYPQISELPLNIEVQAGQTVTLNAPATDPNGLDLDYKWYCYYEASSYWDFSHVELHPVMGKLGDMEIPITQHSDPMPLKAFIKITGANTNSATVTIPANAKSGDDFHFILEVKNVTERPLKSYKRIIITVR